jgi:hypothetical protein
MKKQLTARRLRLDHVTIRDLSAARGAAPSPAGSVYLACSVNSPAPAPLPVQTVVAPFPIGASSLMPNQGCTM